MPYSRAPGIPGNENDHSRIPGNEKTPPGMNSLTVLDWVLNRTPYLLGCAVPIIHV